MCGICGIFSFGDLDKELDRRLLERMCQVIEHRGPDDEGFYTNNNVALGMRRLSIIDVKGGHQPIHNEDKSIWVVYNGEIYNHLDLRRELEKLGHRYYTKTDTESIVHAYEEYGESFVEKFRGMFAFALWDEQKKKLILARDRVGIKPLFYFIDGQNIIFGSEIKCILQYRRFRREIDFDALDKFLSFSFIPGPATMFKGIKRLLPGHMLVCETSKMALKKYWELKYRPDRGKDEHYFTRRIIDLLGESTKLRLMSEVPLGAFLSGGVDSSTVVALMSEAMDEPVNTLSIGYSTGEDYFNELPYAKLVAEKYRTNHRELIVTPEIDSVMFEIIRAFDEPFADSSIVPTWYICKMASRYVTVALSGLGGDELFGGYERYLGVLLAEHYQKLPKFLGKQLLPRLINNIPELKNGSPFFARLKRFVAGASQPPGLRYYSYLSAFNELEKQRLYSDDFKYLLNARLGENVVQSYFHATNADELLDKLAFVDINLYLPDDILTLTDRLSMAHSLEVRVPFLDHVFLEFAATIPCHLKINRLTKKYILTKAVAQKLPQAILRKKKIGFASPFVLWFRRDLKEYVENMLSKEVIEKRGYFRFSAVKKILDDHFSRRANYQRQILSLLTFEIWHRMYLDN